MYAPLSMFQSLAVLSRHAVNTELSSPEKAADLQSLAVLSEDAVNIEVPSPEDAADLTTKPWPAKVWMHSPRSVLQGLAVLS